MNKTSHAFVNQLVIYTLVMIFCSGSVGLGTVWLRHQISVTANRTRAIETSLAEINRHYDETMALIGTEQSPDVLKRRNNEWRLGLVLPREDSQVFRVSEDAEIRLAMKRNSDVFRAPMVQAQSLARPATQLTFSLPAPRGGNFTTRTATPAVFRLGGNR